MKKLFTIMMALALVVGLSASAYAAYGVQLTLTAPSIAKKGCEKAGSITYSFTNGTILTQGDWWYFDLDQGATLCKAVDYFIYGTAANAAFVAGTDLITVVNENVQQVSFGGAVTGIFSTGNATIGAGNTVLDGPIKSVTGGTIVVGPNGGAAAANSVVLRVKGDAGSRRVYVYVYGLGDGVATAPLYSDIKFNITAGQIIALSLFNGYSYDGTAAGIANNAKTNNSAHIVRANTGSTTVFGTLLPETSETGVPYVQNSLCINAENFTGNDVYISLNSKNDFLTFSGDSKIAHVAEESLKLALCKTDGNTFPIATQGACGFDLNLNASTYSAICGAAKNRIKLTSTSPFSGSEAYDIVLESKTTGVYFSQHAEVKGLKSTEDACSAAGTAFTPAIKTTKNSNASGTSGVGFPGSTCTVADTAKVNKIWTTGGAIKNLSAYNALWFDMGALVYDTSLISAGTEVKILATLTKAPCGGSVSETFTLGSFVTTCPTSDGSGATLVYPFLPPMQGLGSWWGGFTITNMTAADGDVTFTFMEYDGDKATYKVTVKAGQTFTGLSDATLLGLVTPDAANTGTFGDSNITVKAVCTFADAAGMTFTGNGAEGVGYTAYK